VAISQPELEGVVRKTSLLFNRLRSPQALTKIVRVSPEMVTIEFSGSLCYECGDVEKYIIDFQKDFKIFVDYLELVAGKAKETNPHGFEVNFFVKAKT
jgi:hypothetical protein